MQVRHTDWITYTGVLIYMLAHLVKQAGGAKGDELPEFDQNAQRNFTKAPGERVVLTCRVHNRGTRVITWRRKDSPHPITIGKFVFARDPRIRVDNNKRKEEWNLVIEGVSPDDKGSYLCIINTHKMKLQWEVQLNVKKKPKPKSNPAVQITGTNVVARGELIQLHCNASGPPDEVEWFKDGQKMTSDLDRGILITGNTDNNVYISVLVIKKSTMEDKGTYICRSTNGDTGQIDVHVLNVDKESVKRGTSAELGSGASSQRLDWQQTLYRLLFTFFCLIATAMRLSIDCS